MLNARDTRAIEATVGDLQRVHGTALDAVVLWGEAATEAYVPGRSPLSIVIVLDRVTPERLRASAGLVRGWSRRRVEPLLFDRDYLHSARDVFPLELLDLCDRHRPLQGKDPFVDMTLDLVHLRIEVEEQLRGKMLHLWDGYLATRGRSRELARLLLDSPPGFEVIGRGMLRLRDADRPLVPDALLETVERVFSVRLPALSRLARARRNAIALPRIELDAMFAGYCAEVRALVEVVDDL